MSTRIQVPSSTDIGPARAILIQFNQALTGSLAVTTAGSTQYGTAAGTVAIITNPTVGQPYRYGGLMTQGDISLGLSATCDITITKVNTV